jgi:hypothetical protein
VNNEDATEALPDTEPGDQPRLRPRGSNQVGMRQFNERVVLQALRVHGSLAKADIARLTGLTAQTIGLITARLDEDQLLRREAPVRGRVGQPSVPLGLHPDGAFAIGIKIGRRSADWLLVDFTGQVRERLVLDYAFPDIPVLLPAIKTNLNRLLKKLGPLSDRVVGVGVAAPFQLGGWHRMLGLTAEQSQAWNQIDLGAEVQKLTDLPVSFAKDTSAACVAELLQGRGRDIRSFLYLFMDTFVGGGLVLNSHLHRPHCRCAWHRVASLRRNSSAKRLCGTWSSVFASTAWTRWPPTMRVLFRRPGCRTARSGLRAPRRRWRSAWCRAPPFSMWRRW